MANHSHNYRTTNQGKIVPSLVGAKSKEEYEVGICGKYNKGHHLYLKNVTCDLDTLHMDFEYNTSSQSVEVEQAKANISMNSAHIGAVMPDREFRVANETRPKNMRAVFIIRIY